MSLLLDELYTALEKKIITQNFSCSYRWKTQYHPHKTSTKACDVIEAMSSQLKSERKKWLKS